MNKRKKKIVGIVVVLMFCIAIFIGNMVKEGNHGKGILAFLVYLQAPIELTEEIYTVDTSSFTIEVDGEIIRGTFFVPKDGNATHRTIVFSHGFNCQSDLLKNKAVSLAQSGVAVVTFDFRGGSVKGTSDGDMIDMTLSSEKNDLHAVIDMVKKEEWCDTDYIYLMGESFGGMVSSQVAPERDDIAGLALCFPALNSADSARTQWNSVEDIPDTVKVGDAVTGKQFWKELHETDLYENLSEYDGRVIILHGTEDENVDYHYSVKANELYKNSELFLIEGAGHGFGKQDAYSSLMTIYHFVTN